MIVCACRSKGAGVGWFGASPFARAVGWDAVCMCLWYENLLLRIVVARFRCTPTHSRIYVFLATGCRLAALVRLISG